MQLFYDTLLVDEINNEFDVEGEEYNLGAQKCNLFYDPAIIERCNFLVELAEPLKHKIARQE